MSFWGSHSGHSEERSDEESKILAFNYATAQQDITCNPKMLLVKTKGFQA
jgi:hypothetical protein